MSHSAVQNTDHTPPTPSAANPPTGLTRILADGLWHRNTALVVLLGLCPLLAVSTTVETATALGAATVMTLTLSNVSVSLLRPLLRPEIRIPAYVLIIASIVTAVGLVMEAWFHELHRALGIFIPLIVTNCAIIGRAEAFASRHPPGLALVDGFATGAGFALTLIVLGATREWLGHLSLIAILPPGAFLALACLIAVRNAIESKRDNGQREA